MEHNVVSHKDWVAARTKFLADEKEFTKERDRMSQARRELPWELVDKEYAFEGTGGKRTLAELFDGRNQLVIYHAMFNPATAFTTDDVDRGLAVLCVLVLDGRHRQPGDSSQPPRRHGCRRGHRAVQEVRGLS